MTDMTAYRILTKPGCAWCDRAKLALQNYDEVACTCIEEARRLMADMNVEGASDVTTFPVVLHTADGGRRYALVGGHDDLLDRLCREDREPMLTETVERFTPFPIQHHDLWDMYKRAVASFWTAEEVSLAQDPADFARLTADEQHFIKHVLAFFASSDGIVMENLAANFGVEVQLAEARNFYAYQMFNEAIHSETYGLLIDALITDSKERDSLFGAIRSVPAVRKKAEWALQWLATGRSFAERLVAFVCVEGILFSGSFCAIYWLKQRGVMPGMCLSNQFISRDEGLHQEFGSLLYRKLRHKLPARTVASIVSQAVDNEKEFITKAIPCCMVGMNEELMSRYVEFVADRIMVSLGYGKIYGASNPFPWMELISLSGKTNFFEHFPSEYQKTGIMTDANKQVFGLDEDF
jgi:ribonucleotide reductase beta subunit family protein with ferritin-like domain